MIKIKNNKELAIMRESGRIAAKALKFAGEAIKPGVTALEVDKMVGKFLKNQGAKSSSLGYGGFPANCCISVNNVAVHGIPNEKCVFKNGDIVSVDIASHINGFHADNAKTFPCGDISSEAKRLIETTEESLYEAIKKVVSSNRIGDISNTVQRYVENRGYSVIRKFVGHGIGADVHEEPSIPNFGEAGRGQRLFPGMVLAIEPMVNEGSYEVKILKDGWTTVTVDGKLSAHFEHTVAVTDGVAVILTDPN